MKTEEGEVDGQVVESEAGVTQVEDAGLVMRSGS